MLILIPSNCEEIVGSLRLTLVEKTIRQSTTHNPIMIIMWFHSKHKRKKSNPSSYMHACNSQCCQSKNEQPILIHDNAILRRGIGRKTLEQIKSVCKKMGNLNVHCTMLPLYHVIQVLLCQATTANKGKQKYTIIIIQSRRKLTHPNIRTIIPRIRSNEKECGPVILKKIIIYKSLPRKILCLHLVYFSMHFVIGYNTIHHQEYYDSQWKN